MIYSAMQCMCFVSSGNSPGSEHNFFNFLYPHLSVLGLFCQGSRARGPPLTPPPPLLDPSFVNIMLKQRLSHY